MKKIQPNNNIASKFLNGIVTKVNAIIDKLIVDVKVNGTSVVTVNEDGEREADIDLSLADQNVKQSPTTDDADYRILLSKSANDTEETDISRKNTNFKYNPSTGNLQVSKVNGNTVPSGSGTVAMLSDIPDELADLTDDSTHRLVTDTEKSTWNDNRAVNLELTNEDLDDVKTVGFYVGKNGNTCANKPSGFNQFGLFVIRTATSGTGNYYKQTLIRPITSGETWTRSCVNGTWSEWTKEITTDENVKQSPIPSTNANYPLLLAYSANGTEETNTVWKDTDIAWNPSTNTFKISNGYMEAYRGTYSELLSTFIGFMFQGTLLAYFSPNPNQASGTTVEAVMPATSGTLALQSELPTEAVEWSEMNVLGAKNLITFPYYHGFNRTTNNVVFTVDDDGIITVGGTQASANASFYLMYNVKLPNGTYTLSDGGVGTTDTYLSCVYYTTPSASAQYYDVANNGSVTFTVNNWDRAVIRIWSRSGKTADNLVFKPMLRLSSIADNTFEPYAMTNAELTKIKADMDNIAPTETSGTAVNSYAVGDYMWWRHGFYRVTQAIAVGDSITTSKVTKTTLGAELKRALT